LWRVKRNEDKKAGKKEGKGARGNLKQFQPKKQKKTSPNFGLCACTKVKFCTLLHGISIKMLLQCEKVL